MRQVQLSTECACTCISNSNWYALSIYNIHVCAVLMMYGCTCIIIIFVSLLFMNKGWSIVKSNIHVA